jgi:hypothetical protein
MVGALSPAFKPRGLGVGTCIHYSYVGMLCWMGVFVDFGTWGQSPGAPRVVIGAFFLAEG